MSVVQERTSFPSEKYNFSSEKYNFSSSEKYNFYRGSLQNLWSSWGKLLTPYRKCFLDRSDHLERAFVSESRGKKKSKKMTMMTIKPTIIFNAMSKYKKYILILTCINIR